MDTGDYETNTLLINNVSSISYRLYGPAPDLRFSFHSAGLNVEKALKDAGHIVCYDANERGLWYFRVQAKDQGDDTTPARQLDASTQISDCMLHIREEGVFEPASLHKARLQSQQSNQTPNGSAPTSSASTTTTEVQQRQGLHSPSASQDNGSNSSIRDAIPPQIVHKRIYESFIMALLSTISSSFCNTTKALPLNYRTVLLPAGLCQQIESQNASLDQNPTLGSFRAFVTTTGALVIGFNISACPGLESLEKSSLGISNPSLSRILAAPFGVLADNEISQYVDGNATTATPGSMGQAVVLKGLADSHLPLWKEACSNVLQSKGFSDYITRDCVWANLAVSKPRLSSLIMEETKRHHNETSPLATIPWPGHLCFRKRTVEVSSTSRVGETIVSGQDESHDPLALARNWFNASHERDEKMSRRRADRTSAAQNEAAQNEAKMGKPAAPSPVAMRQSSTMGASVVYPTPPDALQNLNGVTPSLDGTLSSPGHQLSVANVAEIDAAPPSAGAINNSEEEEDEGEEEEEGEGEGEGQSEMGDTRRLNSEANLLGGDENMFDDMVGDMFDDNDITEADFNFFDEQPTNMDVSLTEAKVEELDDMSVEVTPKPEPAEVHEVKPEPDPSPVPKKDSVIFAKPELKHARSSQLDESQKDRDEIIRATKRSSSPFDPHTIFKKVKASVLLSRATARNGVPGFNSRPGKIFDKVDFDPKLPMLNKKYEHGGLYDFGDVEKKEATSSAPGALPQTNYLKRHSKTTRKTKGKPVPLGSLMRGLSGFDLQPSDSAKFNDVVSDGEDTSSESDPDDSSFTTDDAISPAKVTFRQLAGPVDDDVASQATSLRDMDQIDEVDDMLALELPRLLRPENPEISLRQYFSDPEPFALDPSLSDDDVIQIAQLITEQAAIGSLRFGDQTSSPVLDNFTPSLQRSLFSTARSSLQTVHTIASSILGDVSPLKLKSLVDIQDVPLVGQPARTQPRAVVGRDGSAESLKPSNLYLIPSPHLEVRRAETKLSILPSAVTFWESLGLGPYSGAKDITAVCVFQGWQGMSDNIRTFLARLKSTYEALKLGALDSMAIADQEAGMLQYEVDKISTSPDATLTGHGSAMVESMETLRSSVSELTTVDTNIVVYFVYSPKNPGTIVEACVAFQRFFDLHLADLAEKRETPKNEVVLQLVSADALSSATKMIITPSLDLIRLCLETYDRCTIFGGAMPAPAIRLEQPLPRIIDFKLSINPSASLIRENSCIHVAYATSVDKRWVSAAWTDDRGNEQATASYCFGRRGKSASCTMSDVANEIWESTLQLISVWKVHWRVVITKCGPMEAQEAEFWIELARTEIHASITMILITVDTSPSLQLIPPAVKLPPQSMAVYTTPVSTPQPNIVSPEASATPMTPAREAVMAAAATPGGDSSGEADTESVLADVTDQTWGAICNHRLSNSTSTLEQHPAYISGYLIKRTGAKLEDPPSIMEVNLIHTEAGSRAYEPLLREMLSYFRSLGTLARARGVVDSETDVRPWHVAAAEKAVRALYLLM